jgi:hypothetical protein
VARAGVLAGPDGILDAGMHPVGGVDAGVLAEPASGARRPVRCPQAVPPAVPGLEQGQLCAGMRPLAAREDPHRRGPGLQLVPARAGAQQPGQLGDVRFLDPARPVHAAVPRAGVIGAALADLAASVDRELPRLGRDQPQRCFLPLAQHPADGVGQLIAAAGGELVQVPDQVVAGPGAVAGDHQLASQARRQRGDRRVHDRDVVSSGVRACGAAAQHPGQRFPASVIAHRQQRVMAEALEVRLSEFLV